jgi:hypothetical protein
MEKSTRECRPLILQRLIFEISQRESASHLSMSPCGDMTFTDASMIRCSELGKNQEKRFSHRAPNHSKKFCFLRKAGESQQERKSEWWEGPYFFQLSKPDLRSKQATTPTQLLWHSELERSNVLVACLLMCGHWSLVLFQIHR